MNALETMTGKTQSEIKVPTMRTNSAEGTIACVCDYYLTNNKIRRKNISSQRNIYVDIVCYALNVAEEL